MNNRLKFAIARKYSTRLGVWRDKNFRAIPILKFVAILACSIGGLLWLTGFSTATIYSRRVISKEDAIPEEISSSILILTPEESNDFPQEVDSLLQENLKLLNLRKISQINIFILNNSLDAAPETAKIKAIFESVSERGVTIDTTKTSIVEICQSGKENRSGFQKGLIFTNQINLVETVRTCNLEGVYYVGYTLTPTITPDIPKLISDIFNIKFN